MMFHSGTSERSVHEGIQAFKEDGVSLQLH